MAIAPGQTKEMNVQTKLAGVPLVIQAQQFDADDTETQVVNAQFGDRKILRRIVSFQNGSTVIARIQDDDRAVTILAMDTTEANVGQITIWHDNELHGTYRLDINKLTETLNLEHSVMGHYPHPIDVVGHRQPPPIHPHDLLDALKDDPQYVAFMNGKMSGAESIDEMKPKRRKPVSWKCWIWCMIPACGILCLLWATGAGDDGDMN